MEAGWDIERRSLTRRSLTCTGLRWRLALAGRTRERARLRLTSPPTTVGLDTRQSAEEFSGMIHVMSSPAAISPLEPAASPRPFKAIHVSAPAMPSSPLQATSPSNLRAPLEPTQPLICHQSPIPSTCHTDFIHPTTAKTDPWRWQTSNSFALFN